MSFIHIVCGGAGTVQVDSSLPRIGELYGVELNGDLRWYRYDGSGQFSPDGLVGSAPNSRNVIGNGWNSFKFCAEVATGCCSASSPTAICDFTQTGLALEFFVKRVLSLIYCIFHDFISLPAQLVKRNVSASHAREMLQAVVFLRTGGFYA